MGRNNNTPQQKLAKYKQINKRINKSKGFLLEKLSKTKRPSTKSAKINEDE